MVFNNKKTYYITLIISCILVIYFSYITVKFPYIGAAAIPKSNGEFYVSEVEPKTWSEKNLMPGDLVLEINGKDPQLHSQTAKYGLLEQLESLKIKRGSEEINLKVSESVLYYQNLFLIVIPFTLFLLCMFCSYFIYKSNRKMNLQSASILIWFLFAISMAYLSTGGSSRGDLFGRFTNVSLFLLVPVTYLQFIYHYFKEIGVELFNKRFVYLAYGILFINVSIDVFRNITNTYVYATYTEVKALNLVSFLTLFILIFTLKIIGLRKVKLSEQKYFVKVLIITNVLAFSPFLILYILPFVIFNKHIFPPAALASFLLLIPFSLVYQFLATKIYDIEFLLGRFRYYGLLAILPTLITVFVALTLDNKTSVFYPIQLSIFIYLIMLVVFYLKEIFDFRFKLKRFSEKYNYQDSIFKYTSELRKASNLNQVITELKRTITDVLLVNKAFFLEVSKDNKVIAKDVNPNLDDIDFYKNECVNVISEIGKIKEVDRGFLINIGETDNRNYVLLCLSSINTPKLTRDEISWLKALSFYTNVSLENFLKIEELMNHLETVQKEGTNPSWLTKLFFSIEEKQRSNLAKDLHDSVLQDLISLKRQCEVALVELEAAPADLKDQLEDMNENMTKIIKTTRETCQELRPQLLYDLGLVKALNKLVTQYKEIADFEIRMNAGKFQPNTDLDVQLNLYRIIQELLTNANKHSHASNVLIMLVCIKDKIVLHYEDDGIGFDQNEISYSSESMGLSGITERVKALKGTLTIETSRGHGFKAVIEI
ncbi:histidine kinase [Metabacillus sp. KIGAM252]|uniref:histidine kinase n=1 Tax=Metabacillus flavus TaxID=2823519 RepID=A0ABS5LHU3_9BACI|nr:histidine kinase [Metabacillus flavus]MBS2970329.1 histidine kinase [Metabacillus flavus]